MKILDKMMKLTILLLIVLLQFIFIPPPKAYAATSPDLGDAGSFAVLGYTEITDIPTSTITGDVGLSPASGSLYSGLTTAEVSGTIYAVDNAGPAGGLGNNPILLTSAKSDLSDAYDALSLGDNAPCTQDYGDVVKSLNGLTLGTGVYCTDVTGVTGAFTLSGTLTLTGSGPWIFRSGSSLITSGAAKVVGGDSCNVWWKVPSSATLGTNTQLTGNILAYASITLATGATLNGRALAENAKVSLDSNTITGPTCVTKAAPTPTPTPIPSSSSSYSGGSVSAPAAKSYPVLNNVTPIIIDSRRVSPTSVFISWGPYSGIDTFTIQYGLENEKWLYNSIVTGFSTTINSLPLNQPIWVRIAAYNGSIGTYGEARLIGGPSLPNTGLAPRQNIIPWYFPAGIGIAMSGLLVLIQRKHI
jgi:Ice-binding-like